MAATLHEILLAPDIRPGGQGLLQADRPRDLGEVGRLRGRGQARLQDGEHLQAGHIRHMVEKLLPDIVDQLEPFWAAFSISGGTGFGDYLAKRGDEVRRPCCR